VTVQRRLYNKNSEWCTTWCTGISVCHQTGRLVHHHGCWSLFILHSWCEMSKCASDVKSTAGVRTQHCCCNYT